MDWTIVVVVFLLITWAGNGFMATRYRGEIRRLEKKVDLLYRKLEIDFDKEQAAALSPRIRDLAASGNKIEAIKAYRDATGADLRSAKEAVEAMIPATPVPARNGWDNPSPVTQPDYPGFGPSGLNYSLSPEVRQLVRDKQKIQAIKLLREQTGWGLKEAKDRVDAYERETRQGY
jgi:ribosomal protein L7/L12